MRIRGTVLAGTVLAGCGPGAAPEVAAPPEPAPPPAAAPADAGAPPAPPVDAGPPPPPADPLAGMTAEQRWEWAVARLPQLAQLQPTPEAYYPRLLGDKQRIVLYSPNLDGARTDGVKGYRRCSPIEFLREEGGLTASLPIKGGTVSLTLSTHVDHERLLTNHHTMRAGCGGRRVPPRLSEISDTVVRFAAMSIAVEVSCFERTVQRECRDGSKSACTTCTPRVMTWQAGPRHARAKVGVMKVEKDSPCEACPPNPEAADVPRLQAIVDEHDFVEWYEGGEEFYTTRKACLAAPDALPEPRADERQHGVPLHPELQLVCSQQAAASASAQGGALTEVHWSLYATELPPKQIAAWYRPRLGKALVAGKGSWTAKLGPRDPLGPSAQPERVLVIAAPGAPGPTCGEDAPAGTRTLVRLSTAVRR